MHFEYCKLWRYEALRWLRAAYIFLSCFFVVPVVYFLLVVVFHPLKYISARAHQLCYNLYFEWVASHFGYISETCGARILMHGDEVPKSGRVNSTRHVMMANHQSTCESSMLLAYLGTVRSACRAMWVVFGFKRMRFNPIGIGWWVHGHFFFKRSKNDEQRVKQQVKLRDHVSNFARDNNFKYMVVFPEGGFAHYASIKKSQEYAEKNGLKKLHHVMLPRYGAVWQIFKAFNDVNDPEYKLRDVVNLTIVYGPKNKPPSYLDLIFGLKHPEDYHILTEIIPIDQVPHHDFEQTKNWLNQVWYEKEDNIAYFIDKGRFPTKNGRKLQQQPREMNNGGFIRMLLIEFGFIYAFYLIVTLNSTFFLCLPMLSIGILLYSFLVPQETPTLM